MTSTSTTTTEWLEWRRQGIGASDVAAVLGISPWSSPWRLWAEKVGLLPPRDATEEMEAGTWLESAIAPWFTHRTGLVVGDAQLRHEHSNNPLARCTPDGKIYESPAEDAEPLGLLEIKVTGPGGEWPELPPHHQSQAQWQMYVTGLEHVWFAVLMGRRLDIHELTRDDKDIEFMVKRVEQFWHDHVITGTPPPTDGHDATLEAIRAVHPGTALGKSVDLTGVQWAATELRRAKDLAKQAEQLESSAKSALILAMGDAEIGTLGGKPRFTLREQERRDLDKRALRLAHPRIAKKFETKSTFRVLRETGKEKREDA